MAGFLPANAKHPVRIGVMSGILFGLYQLVRGWTDTGIDSQVLASSLGAGLIFGLVMGLALYFLRYKKAGR